MNAHVPRARRVVEAQTPDMHVIVELLCDIRDLLGECVVRLSDVDARLTAAPRAESSAPE